MLTVILNNTYRPMGGKQRIVRRRWKLLDIIVDILKMNKRYKYKKEHISYTDRAALHNYVYYFSKVGKKNISARVNGCRFNVIQDKAFQLAC